MTRWYLQSNGKQTGPVTSAELKRLVESGKLLPLDLIRREDATDWQFAGQVPGLFPKETVAATPPPLPHDRPVTAPGFVAYIRLHWNQTKGNWFFPIIFAIFLLPVASLFKPLIGWSNLAAFTLLLGLLALTLFVLYLTMRSVQYAKGRWAVTDETRSGLARWTHYFGLLTVPILTVLVAVEYFTPNRGLLVSVVPQLQVLQDDLLVNREPLPTFSEWLSNSDSIPETPSATVDPIGELPVASEPEESLTNARQMAEKLLATLTKYRAEELYVRHFESNAASAERALKQSNDILHRGGKKPQVLDVMRQREEAFPDLEIAPDEEIADELQKCHQSIASLGTQIEERRKDIEGQRILLAKAKVGIEAERKQLEESFKKFSAMSEQQKRQQRDRLEARARSIIGPYNNAITSMEQDISRIDTKLAELKRQEPQLTAAVAESVKRNTDTYFREINEVGPVLWAAGLPGERVDHESTMNGLFMTLFNSLHSASAQMKKLCKQDAPELPSIDELDYLAGITRLIQGDRYYMENQVITIPPKYKSLYFGGRVGPNEVAISGLFRFVGNTTGTNGFGATINVELYECDIEYSESRLKLQKQERNNQLFLQHFEPLEFHDEDDGVEPLIEVLESLLGEEKVAAALAKGDQRFEELLASRKPFVPIRMPGELDDSDLAKPDQDDAPPTPLVNGPKRSVATGSSMEMASYSPDGKYVATSGWNGKARVWNAHNLAFEFEVQGLSDAVMGCVFPDAEHLVVVVKDGQVQVWDLTRRELVREAKLSDQPVRVAPQTVGGSIIIGLPRGHLTRVRLSDLQQIAEIDLKISNAWWITSISYEPSLDILAVTSDEGSIVLCDVGENAVVKRISPATAASKARFSPDGTRLAVGLKSGNVALYDTKSWEQIGQCEMESHPIGSIAFSQNGEQIITGGVDWSLTVWDAKTRQVIKRHWPGKGQIASVQFSPDGNNISFAHGRGGETLFVWPSSSLKP